MGRHKQPIILNLKTRPQVLLNNTPLDEHGTKSMELEAEIKGFQIALKSKQPLVEKALTFQNWKNNIAVSANSDNWRLFLRFLVDDCVYFAEDRERIASSSGHNVASWRTQNALMAHKWERAAEAEADTPPSTKRPRQYPFHPALNQALRERYWNMKQLLKSMDSDVAHITCDNDISLRKIFLYVKKFLERAHEKLEVTPGQEPKARYLARLKEKLDLEQIFPAEELDNGSEFCAGLQSELNQFDSYGITHALIWFFYLADRRVLLRAYQRGYMSAVDCQKNHLSSRRYDFYRKKFLKLQEMFPPQRNINQVTEIQRELFLLVTGFFHLGCNDPEFQNLTIVRFYRKICEIADQRAVPDPALLWSFPWESEQKAEYNQTGDIKIYHRLCDIIRTNPDIIKRAKCKLEKELANFIADKDGQVRDHEIKLLHDLSSLSTTKVLDKNGIITRSDFTNKPDFFNDPVELLDGLTKEEMQYLPRCIREYTALSLYHERLAAEMKETAIDMLISPYRGG